MRRITVLLTLVTTLALSGCATPAATEQPTPATATASADAPATPTPTASVEPEFESVDPALFFVDGIVDPPWSPWLTQDVNFAAPGGGIGCAILDGAHHGIWGCAIDDSKTWEFPRDDPADYCYESPVPCGWGIEAEGSGIPHPRHRGDPGFPGAFASYDPAAPIRVLEIGQSVTFGAVTCYSEERGIRCEHAESGHGFVISRDLNEIY